MKEGRTSGTMPNTLYGQLGAEIAFFPVLKGATACDLKRLAALDSLAETTYEFDPVGKQVSPLWN